MTTKHHSYKAFIINNLKHHALSTKEFCLQYKLHSEEKNSIKSFTKELKRIGNNITDIYIGKLSIFNIEHEISFKLKEINVLNFNDFLSLFKKRDYYKIELSDGSVWILRLGKNLSQYIHIHPARIGKQTIRFTANTWKTALACYFSSMHDPLFEFHINNINWIRTTYLELPTVKKINQEGNIIEAYKLLLET